MCEENLNTAVLGYPKVTQGAHRMIEVVHQSDPFLCLLNTQIFSDLQGSKRLHVNVF